MAGLATSVEVMPSTATLSERGLKRGSSRASFMVFLLAMLGGLGYIVIHVAKDLDNVTVTSVWPYLLLALALVIALGFEFVNGFHDTANAVATVIYTHSLEPNIAVVWSGLCNLAGVLFSSGTVAFAIITLLPVELILQVSSGAGYSMIFALLIAAIVWNLSTWWFGLPASSSHTMVGSIIGVGIANQLLSMRSGTSGVDWAQAAKVFKVLLISPLIGFGAAALLMLVSKRLIKYPSLYEAPKGNQPPPWPIRALLLFTCSGVSFSHGSNDGQKGMGLIMLILIGTMPTAYALNHAVSAHDIQDFIAASEQAGHILDRHVDPQGILGPDARAEVTDYIRTQQLQPDTVLALRELVENLNHEVALYKAFKSVPAQDQTNVRNDMYVASEAIRLMQKSGKPAFTAAENKALSSYKGKVDKATRFIPTWVKVAVALALGLGTMVGWRAHCGHRRRANRQAASCLRARRQRGIGGHGHHLRSQHLGPACLHYPRAKFRRSRNHGSQRERTALHHRSQYRRRLGLNPSRRRSAFRPALLALPLHLLSNSRRV